MYATSSSPKTLKKENRSGRVALLFLVLAIFAVVVLSLTAAAADLNSGLNIHQAPGAKYQAGNF